MPVEEGVAEPVQDGEASGRQQQAAVDGLRRGVVLRFDGEGARAEGEELGHGSPCVSRVGSGPGGTWTGWNVNRAESGPGGKYGAGRAT